MLNNLEQMHLKLLKKENSKSEATGGLAGNIAYKLQVQRTSPQISPQEITNEAENIGLDSEIPKERYISPEKRQSY